MSAQDNPRDFLPSEHRTLTGWERWSEFLIAGALLVIGVILLVYAQDIRVIPSATVSPRIVPQVIGVGSLLVGIWYVIDIIRTPHQISGGEDSEDVDIDAPTDWRALFIIGLGLTLFAFIVQPVGFSLASAAMFAISAYGMGSNKHHLNLAIGLALGIAIFLVFDTWLGVRLPAGWLDGILP